MAYTALTAKAATTAWLARRQAAVSHVLDKTTVDDDFRSAWSDVDRFVEDSKRLPRGLFNDLIFIAACCSSTLMVVVGFVGGMSMGGWWSLFGWVMVFIGVLANVIQVGLTLGGDRGKGEWYQFDRADRPTFHWIVLAVTVAVNIIWSIAGSSNIAVSMNAANDVTASSYVELRAKRDAMVSMRDSIEARLRNISAPPLETLEVQAAAKKEEAICESWKGRGSKLCPQDKVAAGEYGEKCGSNCQSLKEEANKLSATAADARRSRDLTVKIAEADARLAGSVEEGTAKPEASPHGATFEALSGGYLQRDTVNRGLPTVILLFWALVDLALWLFFGDKVGSYRAREYARRAEIGNDTLKARGMAERYSTAPVEAAQLAITSGETTNVSIAVTEDVDAKVDKDAHLRDIRWLFERAIIAADDRVLASGDAYTVYSKLKQEAKARSWMNRADFLDALKRFCQLKGISYDGARIIGHKLGVHSSVHAAAPEGNMPVTEVEAIE